MPNFNRVIFAGHMTRDPETRHLQNDKSVTNFGLAVNNRYKTRDGEQREDTMFIDCESWGRQGEVIAEYMSKGSAILIEGQLKLDQWEDQDGNKRSKHKVSVQNFSFVGEKGGGQRQGGGQGRGQRDQRQDSNYGDSIPF